MSHEALEFAQVSARQQIHRCKSMAEGVGGDPLVELGTGAGGAERRRKALAVDVMPAGDPAGLVRAFSGGGEYPEIWEIPSKRRAFPRYSGGKGYARAAFLPVFLPESTAAFHALA